jgi:alkanesulfonate monooxygenase SsuD/methylene tetrahydromethanopterin reductase-like flavin-dependent oxidoreductase (luciferase family)
VGYAAGVRPLRIGVQLPEVEYVASWADHLEMARVAEAIGLDSLWLGDHLLYDTPDGPRGPWECWSMLAGLAAVTSRITIGPLVACTNFHDPAIIAKKAATIDEISGGRLVLGLGAGWNEIEFRAFGIRFDHRISRFEEAFTIIRELLRDGRSDFQGRFYEVNDCPLLPRGPRSGELPLLIGSNGPRMLRITLPYVDAWNSWFTDFDNDPAKLGPLLEGVDEACRDVGRDPAEIERSVALFVAFPDAIGRGSGNPEYERFEPIRGSAPELADRLREFAAAGIDEVQLVLDPITPASIEALAPVLELLDREPVRAGPA